MSFVMLDKDPDVENLCDPDLFVSNILKVPAFGSIRTVRP